MLDHHRAHGRGRNRESPDQLTDRLVAQVPDETRLPVVERAPRVGVVEHHVHRGIGHQADLGQDRRAELEQRAQISFGLLDRTDVADHERSHLYARPVGSVNESCDDPQLIWLREIAKSTQNVARTSNGWAMRPPNTSWSGCSRYSNQVATPKLPPPPRSPQNRSGSVSPVTVSTSPAAVTNSTDSKLSTARPYMPFSHPSPPPSVSPAMPVVETIPPVVASPCKAVSRFSSPHVTPPCARTLCAAASR